MAQSPPQVGRIGIWSMELRFGDPVEIAEGAAELDELGFGAIWVPGGIGGDVTGDLDRLLAATRRTTIATGIINIWKHEPAEIAGWWKALPAGEQARVLLGIGVSHGPLIGEEWKKPIAATRDCWKPLPPKDSLPRRCALLRLVPRCWNCHAIVRQAGIPILFRPNIQQWRAQFWGPGRCWRLNRG